MTPCTLLVQDGSHVSIVLHKLPITFFQNRNKKTGLAVLVSAPDGDSVGPPLAVERLHEVRDRHWQCQLPRNGATATDAIIGALLRHNGVESGPALLDFL